MTIDKITAQKKSVYKMTVDKIMAIKISVPR